MDIYVQVDGQQKGPFSEPTIREGIIAGEFQPGTLATIHGTGSWQPLNELLAVIAAVNDDHRRSATLHGVKGDSGSVPASGPALLTTSGTKPNVAVTASSEPVPPASSSPTKHLCKRCGKPYKVWSLFRGIGSGLCEDCTKARSKETSNRRLVMQAVGCFVLIAYYKGCLHTKADKDPLWSRFGQDRRNSMRGQAQPRETGVHSYQPSGNKRTFFQTDSPGKIVFPPIPSGHDHTAASPSPTPAQSVALPATVKPAPTFGSSEEEFKRAYGEPKTIQHNVPYEDDVFMYEVGAYFERVGFWHGVAHQISFVRRDYQPLTQGMVQERLDAVLEHQDWERKKDQDGKDGDLLVGNDAVAVLQPYPRVEAFTNSLTIISNEVLAEWHRLDPSE